MLTFCCSLFAAVPQISGGGSHSLVLKPDGTVWAWGGNHAGQLGDGTTNPRKFAIQVKGLEDVVSIAAGWEHNLAVKSDGTVWAWGNNRFGQLGDGTNENRNTPRSCHRGKG